MQTLTIQQFDQLDFNQWKRVITTAKRRVRLITGRPCEIGLGQKLRGGRPLADKALNPIALRIYLPVKRRRVAKAQRIPPTFDIRLRRIDGKYDLLRIRSDVESLRDYVATSASVTTADRAAASGFLIRWSDDGGVLRWGFLTVAHLFGDRTSSTAQVRVSSRHRFRCRRINLRTRGNGLDLAVLMIRGSADQVARRLVKSGLVKSEGDAQIRILSGAEVRSAAIGRQRGRTINPVQRFAHVGEEVFPNGFRLGQLRLTECIRVSGGPEGGFQPGTSGSLWEFDGRPACVQVGGKRPSFREGLGQPVAGWIQTIRKDLASDASLVAVLK